MRLWNLAWRFVTGSRSASLRTVFPVAATVAAALIVVWITLRIVGAVVGPAAAPSRLESTITTMTAGGIQMPVLVAASAEVAAGEAVLTPAAARELVPRDRSVSPWMRFSSAVVTTIADQSVTLGSALELTVVAVLDRPVPGVRPGTVVVAVHPDTLPRLDDVRPVPASTAGGDAPVRGAAVQAALVIVGLVLLLATATIAAVVGAAVGVSVTVRTAEITTLISLGFAPPDVRRMVLWEGALLAAVGALVGSVVAAGITVLLREQGIDLSLVGGLFDLGGATRIHPRIDLSAALIAVAWCGLCGAVSALPPALRAAKMGSASSVWRP